MSRLLLVRHGTTELNSARKFIGHNDAELNAVGYMQVERLRDRLESERIDKIYSSDLKRTLITAQTIASGRQLDVVACPELREINPLVGAAGVYAGALLYERLAQASAKAE